MDCLNGKFYPSWKKFRGRQESCSCNVESTILLPARGALRRKTKLRTYILVMSCKNFATFKYQLSRFCFWTEISRKKFHPIFWHSCNCSMVFAAMLWFFKRRKGWGHDIKIFVSKRWNLPRITSKWGLLLDDFFRQSYGMPFLRDRDGDGQFSTYSGTAESFGRGTESILRSSAKACSHPTVIGSKYGSHYRPISTKLYR